MKKLLLIIALLISGLGLNAQDATFGDLVFTITSETPAECEVSGYSGEPTDVTIPSTVTISGKEYTVTSIGYRAFTDCVSLTSIEIPSSVTSIGEWAFYGCSSLTSIEIPSGVTSIGYYAFLRCSSLTSIIVESGNTVYDSRNACNAIIKTATNTLIAGCKNTIIPNSVTSIGDDAFGSCESLTSIEIPSSVTSIGEWAFSGCSSLTSVTFGENSQLTSIGEWAFSYCSSLTSIEIPSGVTSIGYYAFMYCESLTSIIVESGNTVYDSRNACNAIIKTATNTLIAGCKNTIIPNSVTSIGNNAFKGCSSLTSIEIPSSVTSIGEWAFSGCSSLTSIEIPSGVTSIGNSAFRGCSSLTSIELPSGVTSIGEWAFSGCSSLTSIEIPSGVTSIGNSAFYGCSSLTSIELPNTVTSIGDEAFYYCSSLTSVTFGENSQLTSIGHYAFSDCSSLTSIEIPSGVTSIGDYAFYYCSSLTSIEIPSGVTSIGYGAFYGCSSLTGIEIPSGVTSIGNSAFRGCSSLTSIELPSGVTSIGYYAFYGCSSLTGIEIPSGVTSIGMFAFYYCSSLTSVTFGENSQLTSIGRYAFFDCSSLTSIEIPSGVTEIDNDTFNNCSSLTSIVVESGNTVYDSRDNCNAIIETATNTLIAGCQNTVIPSSVTSIGMFAFYGCSFLTSIEIPNGVTSIGYGAFGGCSSLTSIYCYAESVPETDGDAFYNCPSDMVIYVPEQSVDAYKAASPWNNYTIMPLTDNEDPENPDGNDPEQPTDSVVLVAPALAVDTVTETTVVLVWNAIDSATSYNVYMDSVLVKNVTDTIYTVDSLISDSTYNFMVTAVADTLESEFSNAVTVTTLKAEGEEPEQPENPEEPGDEPEEPIELDAPENVEAKAISTSSIIITWDKVENALSYNIYRDGELLDDTENTSYTDKDLEYNTEYCYTIEAVNGKETSDESEEVCVKTLGEGVEELEASYNIYPNPVSDKLYIEAQTQTQTIEIYDIYGRRQSMVNGQQSTVIDVSDLNSGIYFVKVVTENGEMVKRFIKE